MRGWSIACGLAAVITSLPVAAQQKMSPIELAVPPAIGSPIPTESGKPLVLTPPPVAAKPDDRTGCVPGLPCGTRLLGAVEKNGAVAIEFPALKW